MIIISSHLVLSGKACTQYWAKAFKLLEFIRLIFQRTINIKSFGMENVN